MGDRKLTPVGRQEAGRLMHRLESMLTSGRQILAFDPAGRGRAAEVFGNLDKADRVSVVVPGVDTNLSTFERTARATTAPVGMARSLYAAERDGPPRDAYGRDRVGRLHLARRTRGRTPPRPDWRRPARCACRAWSTSLPNGRPVSLFCHSYGSVLCGVAARTTCRPGSPTSRWRAAPGCARTAVSGLDTRARVWAMRDADDWIADVPYHGVRRARPRRRPGRSRPSARGSCRLTAPSGHAGYFEPGTGSLENFAAIGVGAATRSPARPTTRAAAPTLCEGRMPHDRCPRARPDAWGRAVPAESGVVAATRAHKETDRGSRTRVARGVPKGDGRATARIR